MSVVNVPFGRERDIDALIRLGANLAQLAHAFSTSEYVIYAMMKRYYNRRKLELGMMPHGPGAG